jgi:hypothetical protein
MAPEAFNALLQYGPLVAVLMTFFLPFLRDKLWPDWVAERKAERDYRRKREDVIITMARDMTSAVVSLQKTLEGVATQLGEQAEVLHGLTEDMAVVRAKLNMERPVRSARRGNHDSEV